MIFYFLIHFSENRLHKSLFEQIFRMILFFLTETNIDDRDELGSPGISIYFIRILYWMSGICLFSKKRPSTTRFDGSSIKLASRRLQLPSPSLPRPLRTAYV